MKLIQIKKRAKVAFLGLGNMGSHMAGHLQRNGCRVTVYNRSEAKSKDWVAKYGGGFACTVEDAVKNADFVICCVGNDHDLESVAIGKNGKSGAFDAMRRGAFFIDHTTTSSTIAQKLSLQGTEKGIKFIDAPVSGGKIGAKNGTLTAFCGCFASDFDEVRKILKIYCKEISLVGKPGTGQLAKMVNQICSAGALRGVAEGISFGLKAGLDMKTLLHAMSFGSASSWQMANRGLKMLEQSEDVDFAINFLNKDLKLALDQAKALSLNLRATEIIQRDCEYLVEMGLGEGDTHNIFKCIK